MWWRKAEASVLCRPRLAWPMRLAVVLAAAGLTAGCWQPLYGARPTPGGEGVQDKFASVEIPTIAAPKGTPTERVAVGMFNALQFDLHNGQSVFAPAYQLKVYVGSSQFTSYIDPISGRPDSSIEIVVAVYQLVELATGKMVINDTAYAHVSYDNPGSQQRYAGQRARRDAEDHAITMAADMIRNRLASYFVAGT
jgi:LPS-assembly lipoprotein